MFLLQPAPAQQAPANISFRIRKACLQKVDSLKNDRIWLISPTFLIKINSQNVAFEKTVVYSPFLSPIKLQLKQTFFESHWFKSRVSGCRSQTGRFGPVRTTWLLLLAASCSPRLVVRVTFCCCLHCTLACLFCLWKRANSFAISGDCLLPGGSACFEHKSVDCFSLFSTRLSGLCPTVFLFQNR